TAADFAVSVAPGTQFLEAKGENAQYLVSVTALRGFNAAVNLAATGLPAGVTATFNPTMVNAGQTATLTLATTANTPSGPQPFTIQGTSGSTTRTIAARLEVGPVWPRFHHDARGSGRALFNGPQTTKQPWTQSFGVPIFSSPAIGGDNTVYYG